MLAKGLHIVIGSDGAAFSTARAAHERGYETAVLVPRGAPSVRALPRDVKMRDLDQRDLGAITRAFRDATFVYYCCGSTGLPIDEDEPEHLGLIIRACKQVGARFIYCDAPFAYGNPERALSEELPQRARDPLGAFLAALSQFVLQSHRTGEVKAVLARHADLIGPEVVRSPFGDSFFRGAMKGRRVDVLGRMDAPRSLTYASDLGRALVLLAEQEEAWGQMWHMPSTPPVSPQRLIDEICECAHLPPVAHGSIHEIRSTRGLRVLGGTSGPQVALARSFESEFTLLSAKFERAFGMHATGFHEIVGETVAWIRQT